jgi:hypothetical protein
VLRLTQSHSAVLKALVWKSDAPPAASAAHVRGTWRMQNGECRMENEDRKPSDNSQVSILNFPCALARVTAVSTFLWTPDDWTEIEEALR